MAITFPLSRALRIAIEASAASLAWLESKGYLGLFDQHDEIGELEWRRLQVIYTRLTPANTAEDVAVNTFDLINITSGGLDTTWTTGDYTTCETAFDAFYTTYKAGMSPKATVSAYKWYVRKFNPADPGNKPYLDSGDPVRTTVKAHTGTGSGTQQVPYQVAISVTEKTPIRRSWGRIYLPNPGITMFDAFGRIANPAFVADAMNTLYETLWAADFIPVVPSAPGKVLLPVTSIQVDDVPDVIRARRPRTVAARVEHDLNP